MSDSNPTWNPEEDYPYPLMMSGAGLFKYPDRPDVDSVLPYVDLAVVGSITLQERKGNTVRVLGGQLEYFDDPDYSVNNLGMPNSGVDNVGPARSPKLVASIAGFNVDEYVELYERFRTWGAGVEFNCGCPNTDKRVMCFNIDAMDSFLSQCPPRDGIVGIKVSPYSDKHQLREVASMFNDHAGLLKYVATMNTYPNGMALLPDETGAVDSKEMGAFGGIGGKALKQLSLGDAATFYECLDDRIGVIRVGGIDSGLDIKHSLTVGCKGVQVVTAIATQGPKVIKKMRDEYTKLALA